MKNILVLGGAGYIGSVVVEQLISKGFNVTVYDNLSLGHRQAVDCNFIEGDISDLNKLSSAMKDMDAVMHFCALSIVPQSMKIPEKYFENNFVFGLNILNAMVENNVKKIIFSSTAATYGIPKEMPITENLPQLPTNPYGESKLMFEKALKWYSEIHGIQYVTLRYFNAAGCSEKRGEDHDPETHLIPIILDHALGKRDKIYIFGDDYNTDDGTCVRDYIHVLDLASAHILALGHQDNGIFNLGCGKGYSVKEIISTTEEVIGKKLNYEIADRRPGDPDVLIASSELISKTLGWKPEHGLKDIIQSAYDWRKKNPNGY